MKQVSLLQLGRKDHEDIANVTGKLCLLSFVHNYLG